MHEYIVTCRSYEDTAGVKYPRRNTRVALRS